MSLVPYTMKVLLSFTAYYIVTYTAGYFLNLSESRMEISITCPQEKPRLRLIDHFVVGGYVEDHTCSVEYSNHFNFIYVPYAIRWGFKGTILCQIQNASPQINNYFIMIRWEVPIFGAPKINSIVVETGNQKLDWNHRFLEEKYNSLHIQFKHHTDYYRKMWSLSNGKKITLASKLTYTDKNYLLTMTATEEMLNDMFVHASLHIEP
jgi:hypothetical protein